MSVPKSAASIVSAQNALRRRRRRRGLIALGVVSGLALFTVFGLPPIIRAQAIKRLSIILHREVAIERIRLNPFALTATVEGLQIKDRDSGAFTSWNRLFVDFDGFSLFTGEWHFQEVTLDGFTQRVAIAKDGSFNFADLLPPLAAPTTAPVAASKPPRPLRISRLTVSGAAVAVTDASRKHPFATTLGPLTFTLENFITLGHPKAPYSFSATTEAGETLSWKGTVSIDPIRSSGEFSVSQFSLKKYAPYYHDHNHAELLDGILDVSGRYVLDLTEATPQLLLSDARVKLSRLQLAERGSTTPLIDLPSLAVEGINADAIKRVATVARVALDGGHISVVREADGSINLLKLHVVPAPPVATKTSVAAPTPSLVSVAASLPDVKLGEFKLTGLAIDIEDRVPASPVKNGLSRLDVSVKNISLAEAAAPVQLKLSALTVQDGLIDIEGSAVREPLAADLSVKISALPLAAATSYIEPMLNLRIAGGELTVEGRAQLAGSVARFQGDVSVDKFATVDGVKGDGFVGFNQLAIKGIDAVSAPLSAKVAEVLLVDPTARLVINDDKTTNLSSILRLDSPAPTGSTPTQSPVDIPSSSASVPAPAAVAPVWSLGVFTLKNGWVSVLDRSIQPVARITLDYYWGTVSGLSSANLERADVDFRGQVNGTGSVVFTGKLDAKALTLSPGAITELLLEVKGVDLAPISPYLGTYAGYELARGGLGVEFKTHLTERKVIGTNVITLNQFTFGEATNNPAATGLPVRLGVALLKDTRGNIVIDVPIQGSLDDPEFKIGRVVLRVIVNLLMKAATSPFSLIGSAFGGGGDELAYQEFTPGAELLQETESKKIDTLRKSLKGRPALSLDITGSFDAVADLAAIREQRLDQQVRFRLWQELRIKNPQIPLPSALDVSAADEARIIGLLYAEQVTANPVSTATGDQVKPLTDNAAVSRAPLPAKTPAATRATPYVKGQYSLRKSEPKPKPVPAPVVVLATASDGTALPGAAPILTLADARQKLASLIPVSDDDLRQLADIRAIHVRDALLAGGQIEANRIFLTPPTTEGKGPKVLLQLR